MTRWRRSFHFKREWYRTVEIEDGWKVRMAFRVTNDNIYQESDVDVSLIAYRGRWVRSQWRHEGKAVGPGGLAVASAALKLLSEAEEESVKRVKYSRNAWLYVMGSSLNLYLLYRRVLAKRGYMETWEDPGGYGPYMIKQLG